MVIIGKNTLEQQDVYAALYKTEYFQSTNSFLLKLIAGSILLLPLGIRTLLFGIDSTSYFFYSQFGLVIIGFEFLFFVNNYR